MNGLKIKQKAQLEIFVNDKRIIEQNPDPQESLISLLRRHGYTGTKLGCGEGGCGSCTVMVSSFDYKDKKVVHHSVNSCLAPACSLHKKHVLTIEGLGNAKDLHKVQQVVANSHGSQCGFCTPGIVMSLYTELKTNPNPTEHSIEDAFDGNLCRCTGYRPILQGAKKLSHCGNDCNTCPTKSTCEFGDLEDFGADRKVPPYPVELLQYHTQLSEPEQYIFEKNGDHWVHPSSKASLLKIKELYPHAKIINGNTEVGIEVRFKNFKYPVYINTSDLSEMKQIKVLDDGIEMGALITVSNMQSKLGELCSSLEPHKTRGFQAILDNVKYFAGKQIRNVSAIAGNICTASPISDLNPVLVALGAVLTVESATGTRKIHMTEFFLGYRKINLEPSEVLVSVFVPFTKPLEFTSAFKQAKRRDDDIAIVTSAFSLTLEKKGDDYVVNDSCFSYGGMGPFSLHTKKTNAFLRGKVFSKSVIEECYPLLLEDMPLQATSPGGQIQYRKTLAQSFLLKFYLRVCDELSKIDGRFTIDSSEKSSLFEIERGLSHGVQGYQESTEPGAVGKAIVHAAADKQVTGEAVYVDDMPKVQNELYAAVVGSTISHGKIISVDPSEALKARGVVSYVSRADVAPANEEDDPNMIGAVFHDEELFATDMVYHMGQMIGLIVADNETNARAAAKLVKVEYEKLPALYTCEEAIEAKSFFKIERNIKTGAFNPEKPGNPVLPIDAAVHHVSGVSRMSAQEHFYLETNASLVVPGKEDDEIEVFASTQNPTETQHYVAHVLGIADHKVVCRVKRLGGGFGGKESRSVPLSCALAVAAKKLGRAVRCMFTREEDMAVSGTRHPFLGNYKVGFTGEGKLVSLELDVVFANAGYSYDLSLAVLERSMTHCDNAYRIPHVNIHGRLCKTNIASNTAYRGFGGPQGMMFAEHYMHHIADYLGKPVEDIRKLNLYEDGEVTHFDMPIENVFLRRCWDELEKSSDFINRRNAVKEYNRVNKYRKRGITLMPTKFGLAFTARFLNQAAAMVHVYTDGSVRISHGGTEMGQGLHTKMLQIVAHAFEIPFERVFLSETRTDICANTSATAASVSSDLNGMALQNACEQILDRLKPLREKNPTFTWEKLVKTAYMERINLCANGFYRTPDLSYDWATNEGRMFSYFTYGVACTEVEIDTLSGDHLVLRSDVLMDIGRPINPAIDIGQIEGAFTQGMGWSTIEEPLYSPTTGFLLTRGPGLYKIPGFKDIPIEFNVKIMDGVRNTRAIHSSKAVGEPPFFMGASCMFAIRDAIQAARADQGLKGYFRLDCPATSERIRVSCEDDLAKRAYTPLAAGEKPWGVPV
ncbi:molybdopterin binding aldehyde oxidase/xanthine dehydrogenase [Globomyces pollinis-pini]|nr:molybdopterin binding aldehyde oxidase/xanthine dehydrogenase [Globomyces pollinis-pini]